MIRIGLIGSDGGIKSGHSRLMLQVLSEGIFNAEVTHIYGDNKYERDELAKGYNIKNRAENVCDMLGKVDAVMVMQRNGALHLNSAMPFLEKGYPVFVDKPLACSVSDAEKMVNAAKKSGALLFGGSSLKYDANVRKLKSQVEALKMSGEKLLSGYISYPMYANESYGGIHFYSHHLIEEMMTVFGNEVRSVYAKAYGVQAAAIADYGSFPVYMNFTVEGEGLYVSANFDKTSIMHKQVNESLSKLQLEKFLQGVINKKAEENPEYFLDAVKISAAIERAINEKREIELDINKK